MMNGVTTREASRPGDENRELTGLIPPQELAFDIDGVVADTMAVFVRLAGERYNLSHLRKSDLRTYDLYECLDLDREIISDLICLTLDDHHTLQTPSMPGAREVLTEISRVAPLRFITARIWPESVMEWLVQLLPEVDSRHIQVTATGSPEAKLHILRDLGIRYFLEDRLETCRLLASQGIQPLLFDQPWNRVPEAVGFHRIEGWSEFRQMLLLPDGK